MKTILLHVHDDSGQHSRMQAAVDLAHATGAHINCLQVTPLAAFAAASVYGGNYGLPDDLFRRQEEENRQKVETLLRDEGLSWDWRQGQGDTVQCLLSASRLADAIVVTLPTRGQHAANAPLPIVADLVVSSRSPVLAVPAVNKGGLACGGRAMIAWDGTHEAAIALCAARPLLMLASEVHVVTVEEKSKRDCPPGEAGAYLARHDIRTEVHEWPRKGRSVEEALEAAAVELHADWIVMGAFGHSRLREIFFGGVTRYLLGEARVPLLLAH